MNNEKSAIQVIAGAARCPEYSPSIVDGESHEHCLGFMQWDSLTQNFEYSNLGLIKSLSELSNHLADEFSS